MDKRTKSEGSEGNVERLQANPELKPVMKVIKLGDHWLYVQNDISVGWLEFYPKVVSSGERGTEVKIHPENQEGFLPQVWIAHPKRNTDGAPRTCCSQSRNHQEGDR
jgi:hypothetical protein